MAKGTTGKAGGSSRIRFIMVEAEMADGDISQITQAIQNALRGPSVPVQRLPSANGTKVIAQDAPEFNGELEDELELEEPTPKPSKPKPQRKPAPTPEVLELDLTSERSLSSYAQEANPQSDRKRYLVIASWFKDHRGVNAITVNHIYTCYRFLKWPTSIDDFAKPLRQLKFEKYFTSPEKGHYAINHLGLAEVSRLMSGGE